jgi:hypothetical protein
MTTVPATLLILSARFAGDKVTSYNHEFNVDLYKLIPDLYAVLIAKGAAGPRKIVGGFIMKTGIPREPSGPFQDAAQGLVILSPKLRDIAKKSFRLLPARLHVEGSDPLSEDEMLRTLALQRFKWEEAEGHA